MYLFYGYVSYFKFGAIRNSIIMNILLPIFCENMYMLLLIIDHRMELWVHTSKEFSKTFDQLDILLIANYYLIQILANSWFCQFTLFLKIVS